MVEAALVPSTRSANATTNPALTQRKGTWQAGDAGADVEGVTGAGAVAGGGAMAGAAEEEGAKGEAGGVLEDGAATVGGGEGRREDEETGESQRGAGTADEVSACRVRPRWAEVPLMWCEWGVAGESIIYRSAGVIRR